MKKTVTPKSKVPKSDRLLEPYEIIVGKNKTLIFHSKKEVAEFFEMMRN
jgi:hypothetical protein